MLGVPAALQIAAFAGISVVGLLLTRPWLLRVVKDCSPLVPTGVDAMRGRIGVVTGAIGELDSGTVKVEGETWTARSYFEREEIAEGTRIEVVEIRGVTALVIPAPTDRELPKGHRWPC